MLTAEDFAEAVVAYGAASTNEEIAAARETLKAITPPGLYIRPDHKGRSVNIELDSAPGVSFALLYLCQPRQRVIDPQLARIAWGAIWGAADALNPAA